MNDLLPAQSAPLRGATLSLVGKSLVATGTKQVPPKRNNVSGASGEETPGADSKKVSTSPRSRTKLQAVREEDDEDAYGLVHTSLAKKRLTEDAKRLENDLAKKSCRRSTYDPKFLERALHP